LSGTNFVTKILLNAKADPKVRDDKGNTALHYAVVQQSKACTELLVSRFPETLSIANNQGQTPLDFCTEEFKKFIMEDLRRPEPIQEKVSVKTENTGNKSTKVETSNQGVPSHLSEEPEV